MNRTTHKIREANGTNFLKWDEIFAHTSYHLPFIKISKYLSP